jgi:hypothetical protein
MRLIPTSLKHLANITRSENLRYAMGCVKLTETAGNDYRAEVTDGRSAITVDGTAGDPGNYPPIPALDTAPKPAQIKRRPNLDHVATVLGTCGPLHLATMASTDGTTVAVATSTGPDTSSRFPDLKSVEPTSPPTLTVEVDALALAQLLETCAKIQGARIRLELRADPGKTSSTKPIVLVGANPDRAVSLRALFMPLS